MKERRVGVGEGAVEGEVGERGKEGTEQERGVGNLGRWSEIEGRNAAISSSSIIIPTFSITPKVAHIAIPSPTLTLAALCKSDKFTTEGRKWINKEEKMRKRG